MTVTMGTQLVGVKRCPHCSVAHPTLQRLWGTGSPIKGAVYEGREQSECGRMWAVFACQSCGGVVLCASCHYQQPAPHVPPKPCGKPNEVILMFPSAPTVDDDLPERARNYLRQAIESIHAPDGAAILVASAVDAMLKDKGFDSGSLYSRIEKAISGHVLTPSMGEWAHQIRLDANDVRHADLDNPHRTPNEAKQLIEFAKALGQFLYVLPAQVAAGLRASSSGSVSSSAT